MKQQMPCDSSNLSIFMTFFTLPKPSWACALQVFKYSTLLFFFLRIFHIQAKGKTSTEQIHSMQLKCFFFLLARSRSNDDSGLWGCWFLLFTYIFKHLRWMVWWLSAWISWMHTGPQTTGKKKKRFFFHTHIFVVLLFDFARAEWQIGKHFGKKNALCALTRLHISFFVVAIASIHPFPSSMENVKQFKLIR